MKLLITLSLLFSLNGLAAEDGFEVFQKSKPAPTKDCQITPGSNYATCQGEIYIRKNVKEAAKPSKENPLLLLDRDDLKTFGEKQRSLGKDILQKDPPPNLELTVPDSQSK